MPDVYSILAHGQITTAETLDHKQRNRIPIVSIGKEGEPTYATPTYLLIQYFMQRHGARFMKRLLTVLIEHGEKYTRSFVPDPSLLEQDIRFLFDVNQRDQKRNPSTVLRAYYGRASIVDMDLFVNIPYETLLFRSFLKKDRFDHNNPTFFQSDTPYRMETLYYSPQSMMFSMVSPFGLLRWGEAEKSFQLVQRIPPEGVSLKTTLDYIHGAGGRDRILFLICCKQMDKTTMMDFEIGKHPLQTTLPTLPLVQMMSHLKLTDTSQKRRTATTRKRKTNTRSRSRSRKRTKLA